MCSHNLLHINNSHIQSEISSFNIVILCACIWNTQFTWFSNSEYCNFNLIVHKFNFLSKILWCRHSETFFNSGPYESDKIIYEHDLWHTVVTHFCCCLVAILHLTLLQTHELSGFSVHGISQTRILEWVAITFCRGSFQPRDSTHLCCIGRQILYHPVTREVLVTHYIV